jgi:hypothetical protein
MPSDKPIQRFELKYPKLSAEERHKALEELKDMQDKGQIHPRSKYPSLIEKDGKIYQVVDQDPEAKSENSKPKTTAPETEAESPITR